MAMIIDNNDRSLNCPLCKSQDILLTRALLRYSSPTFFSSEEIQLLHPPELFRCRSCHSGFIQNRIPESMMNTIYTKGHSGTVWSSTPFEEDKTDQVKRELEKVIFRGASVLDIGCNVGTLLDYCRQFGCRTSGVELSESSRLIVEQKNHVAYSTLSDVAEKFDIVFAFDLIEHLHDVPAFMSSVASLLHSSGKCVILTGDINSLSAKLSGGSWWYLLAPEHIVFPSRQYFSSLGGFRLKAFQTVYNAKNYDYSSFRMLRGIAGNLIIKGRYNGTPALGPDHMMVVLERTAN